MDIKALKDSGILELYVLGLASEEEVRSVETLLKQHPEIAEEVALLQEALYRYALAHSVDPPEGLKEKILHSIAESTSASAHSKVEKDIPRKPNRICLSKPGLTLISLLLIVALAACWYFYEGRKSAQQELREIRTTLEQVLKDCKQKEQNSTLLQEQLMALRDPSTLHIPLRGTEIATSAFATIFYNPKHQKIFLDAHGLPQPPQDKQYQLWAIVEGKPMDMGVFEFQPNDTLLQPVPFVESPNAFAITLEPLGGRPEPSLDQLYVIGNVNKS